MHPRLGRAHRVGITGPPGAENRRLARQLVQAWRERGLTVAVVAVDPTSPFSGGASSATGSGWNRSHGPRSLHPLDGNARSLGGLATSTREVCDVLDAGGFDRILIETVGVGQSELAVTGMADSTVLLLVPESGDAIQTLKSGVMEAADLYVVNKADRPGADKLRARSK